MNRIEPFEPLWKCMRGSAESTVGKDVTDRVGVEMGGGRRVGGEVGVRERD